eukprot:10782186-Karenia_brevis.AAC.1
MQMDYTAHSDIQDSSWDRRPDFTILRASASINFSREALKEACAPWLGANFQDNQYEFVGPETGLAKNWGIKVRGNPRIAKRNRDRAHNLLNNNGDWIHLYIRTPAGERTRLFVNFDKSAKQVKIEILSK